MRPFKVAAIVPAAGCGKRLGTKTKKPFVKICGHPLVSYALKTLEESKAIDAIIIATEEVSVKRMRKLASRYRITKLLDVVEGSSTRSGSVNNCLKRAGNDFGVILIHDAARPFLDEKMIEGVVEAAYKYGAAIIAFPESDTVKVVDKKLFVKKTLDRTFLYRAQTPQAFKYDVIKKAYSGKFAKATDDASLIETAGGRVKIVNGSYRNLKVTTREDIKIAEALLCG